MTDVSHTHQQKATSLGIAMFGLGTIGTGVARLLLDAADRLARRSGRPVDLKHVVVRDVDRGREVDLPAGLLHADASRAIADPDVDVVIELIGGLDAARDIVREALQAGKDVVTANKALLSVHGAELFGLARDLGRTICFEAAVAGGVPIVAGIGQNLAANQITNIEAILNGTSNFILTRMARSGYPFATVVREAQELGYAEADPTMDINGTDAAQKLSILVQLAYGTKVETDHFLRQGIESLEAADLFYAEELGYAVKLLAVARLTDSRERGMGSGEQFPRRDGIETGARAHSSDSRSTIPDPRLEVHVQPTLVRADRPLAGVEGPRNMIAVDGDAVGTVWWSGPGAGQMATASAVVADVIDLAIGRAQPTFRRLELWDDHQPVEVMPLSDISRRTYFRFHVEDRPHVVADIADILGRHQISLASIIQHEAPEQLAEPADVVDTAGTIAVAPAPVIVPLVVMTHRASEGQLRAAEAELGKLTSLRSPWVRMPVAD